MNRDVVGSQTYGDVFAPEEVERMLAENELNSTRDRARISWLKGLKISPP
jgi:hypothetical protein